MSSHNIVRSIQYNEQKVTQNLAECISVKNILKDASRLTVEDKLRVFQRRMELNDHVSTCLHITLNFHPKDLRAIQYMQSIADTYMEKIGFGHQPYLVYRHNDAAHPHCHIVTTHIKPDGDPIDLYKIGSNLSEKAKQSIEQKYMLLTKEKKQALRPTDDKNNYPRPIIYGKDTSATAMSRVIEDIYHKYHYSSLGEFNAALRFYNLEACRGSETSKLYQNRGILFRILDENGRYIGRPIRASFFDCKPTLDNLEQKFRQNQSIKQEKKWKIECAISYSRFRNEDNLELFNKRMLQEHAEHKPILDKRSKQCISLFYIDFYHMCVWDSKDLAPHCSKENYLDLVKKNDLRIDHERRLEQSLTQEQKLQLKQQQKQQQRQSITSWLH